MTEKDVAYTSVQAYREAVMSGIVRTQRDKIFRWLCKYSDADKSKDFTRNEIAYYLKLRLSSVCGRIDQLIKDGFVVVIQERKDIFTGITAQAVAARKSIEEFEQLRAF